MKTALSVKRARTLKVFLFAVIALPWVLAGCLNDVDTDQGPLIIASYGGYWQEVLQQSMFVPYAAESSREVIDEIYNGQYQPMLDQAALGVTRWDLVNVEGNMVILGEDDGILERIDYSVVDSLDLIPEARHSHGVGVMTWSWILAYSKSAFPQTAPNSWADFFDIDRFPGSRGLQKDPRRVLEAALLADGVSEAQLYPLNVDRALAKLDQLIADLGAEGDELVWWSAYAEPAGLINNGTVVMTPGTNGRILQAIEAGGTDIAYTWSGGIIDLDWWVVMKDTPNKKAAMEFLKFASSVQAQRQMSTLISYGPVNPDALALLPATVREKLPTHPANLDAQLFFDTEWWSANYESVLVRWNQWFEGL